MTRKHLTLTVALLSGMGLATPAFAQTAEQQQAQLEAQEAREAAAEATEDALDAQAAAATADVVSDVAPTSAAAAISADVAAANATRAAAAAGLAVGAAANAHMAADDASRGHMVTKQAAEVADEAEDVARAASAVADNAAASAQFATRVAATAAANPPQVVVPASPHSDRPAVVGNDNVTFSDHPGNSISPAYSIDFSAMDGNDDGVVVRAEARGNADLMREFHVVDLDNDGRLTRVEMKDWINPLSQ